ncbi:MAG: GyrI-like domain-containing protein [Saccharospirillaceae bacterium]|nr:GyrI-like domain-containing protein [Pseudomonadales bacterium]NRB79253.1 GyrI-like domain-containing protein [Saccharospirillaceae bacterium]
MNVEIIDFKQTDIAVLEHRGAPSMLMHSVQKFISWRKKHHLPPSKSRTFGLIYDDPSSVSAEEFRFDVCAELFKNLDVSNDKSELTTHIKQKTIPAGKCARIKYFGSTDDIEKVVLYLYDQWLPKSGENLRDFPVYFQYIKMMPQVGEFEQETDVFLPLI